MLGSSGLVKLKGPFFSLQKWGGRWPCVTWQSLSAIGDSGSSWVSVLPSLEATGICEVPCGHQSSIPCAHGLGQRKRSLKGNKRWEPDSLVPLMGFVEVPVGLPSLLISQTVLSYPLTPSQSMGDKAACCHEYNLILIGRQRQVSLGQPGAPHSPGGLHHPPSLASCDGSKSLGHNPLSDGLPLILRGICLLFFCC